MSKHGEQQSAARQFYADAQRPRSAREECEAADDVLEGVVDEWAERLAERGIARLLAQQCAGVVVELLQERNALGVRDEDSEGGRVAIAALVEGVRMIAIKQYQAPKPRLSAGCLMLALGEKHPDFKSARELAAKQQVSHELAANGVEDWQEVLGLPKTSGQKSEAAVAAYQTTNGKLKLAA